VVKTLFCRQTWSHVLSATSLACSEAQATIASPIDTDLFEEGTTLRHLPTPANNFEETYDWQILKKHNPIGKHPQATSYVILCFLLIVSIRNICRRLL